jgi:hypothetical protein
MNHQPECLSADAEGRRSEAPIYGLLCICDRLEACEKRIQADAWKRYSAAMQDGWEQPKNRQAAMNAALDAAREAVAAALAKGLATSTDGALYFFELSGDPDFPNNGYYVTFRKDSLIAAIDALRRESDV